MEWFVIILSGFLVALTPAGLVIDQAIAGYLRTQVKSVEQLKVRVDNVPTYQIIKGNVDQIRIASRGIKPTEDIRIDTLEIQTDPIGINLEKIQGSKTLLEVRQALTKPLQGAIRLVIEESDLNQALASPSVQRQIQKIIDGLLPEGAPPFYLKKTDIEFLNNQKIKLTINLEQDNQETGKKEELALEIMTGLAVIEGRSLQFIQPEATINGRRVSSRFLNSVLKGVEENLNLNSLEKQGIWVRIIDNHLEDQQIHLALFIRLDPELNR